MLLFATAAHASIADYVVVDEVYYDGAAVGDDDEFIELYNPTASDVDISGWWLGDEETQGGGEFYGQIPGGTVLGAGERILIAKNLSGFQAQFGFAPDLVMGFALSNGGDEMILSTGYYDGYVDVVAWEGGSWPGVVSYGAVPTGQSMSRDPAGEDTDDCPVDFVTGSPTPESTWGGTEPEEGSIAAWFNRSVAAGYATYQTASGNADFFATATDLIDAAQYSIDVCLYTLSDSQIGTALLNADARGVTLRVIVEDGNHSGSVIDDLEAAGVPVIDDAYGLNDGDGLMHNKFLTVDARAGAPAGSGTVLGGSWNFNWGGWNYDANNLVRLVSDGLAQAYTAEFDEMWGSAGDTPSSTESRFGDRKYDNTVHSFLVDTVAVEQYFGPSDGLSSEIQSLIAGADYEICFCIFSFTRQDISDAMKSRYDAGVEVRGVFDEANDGDPYSEYNDMTGGGENPWSPPAPVILDDLGGNLHHKYMLIDPNHPASDPVVITGSNNWSSAAEYSNDENMLVLHDANLANQYYQEFAARYGMQSAATPIHDVQYTEDPSGDSPLTGSQVTVEGVVTALTYDSSAWTIQDAEGAWNGIYVYTTSFTPSVGQTVGVTGTVQEYYGLTEIYNLSDWEVLGADDPPAPSSVDCASANDEQWESVLITVSDVTVTDPDLGYGEFLVEDASGSLRVDDLSYSTAVTLGQQFASITGYLHYSYDNHKLEPRSADDFVDHLPPPDPVTDLQIYTDGNDVFLTWSASAGATSYHVHRLAAPRDDPDPGNLIATVYDAFYSESAGAAPSSGFYVVVAVN